jgi:hypothetical protein
MVDPMGAWYSMRQSATAYGSGAEAFEPAGEACLGDGRTAAEVRLWPKLAARFRTGSSSEALSELSAVSTTAGGVAAQRALLLAECEYIMLASLASRATGLFFGGVCTEAAGGLGARARDGAAAAESEGSPMLREAGGTRTTYMMILRTPYRSRARR